MAEEKTYMQMLQEKMPVVFDLDADTVRDSAGDIRYNNLNAPEVDHMEKHSFVPGDWGGEFYTLVLLMKLGTQKLFVLATKDIMVEI